MTRVGLTLKGGLTLDSKAHQGSSNVTWITDDDTTRVCEKGVASVEIFNFYADRLKIDEDAIEGTFLLDLIGGQVHRQAVAFTQEK